MRALVIALCLAGLISIACAAALGHCPTCDPKHLPPNAACTTVLCNENIPLRTFLAVSGLALGLSGVLLSRSLRGAN